MTKSADLQRLASLSDCVFAVAMTLLAFSVRIPDHGVDPAKLPGELTRMWNESFGLVLSFAIAAMFWVRAFSPAAFPQSCDCWPDLPEPFSAILDRGTPDFDEPLDPNRSESNNDRYGSEFDANRIVRTSNVGLCVPNRTRPYSSDSGRIYLASFCAIDFRYFSTRHLLESSSWR
jgi:hypothetical protein